MLLLKKNVIQIKDSSKKQQKTTEIMFDSNEIPGSNTLGSQTAGNTFVRHEIDKEADRRNILVFFEKLGSLHQPETEAIRDNLLQVLREYSTIVAELRANLGVTVVENYDYRLYVYKIRIAELVLKTPKGIKMVELVEPLMQEFKAHFDAEELYTACGVVSVYLGQTLPDIDQRYSS